MKVQKFTKRIQTLQAKNEKITIKITKKLYPFLSYTRYADDWIILTNANQIFANVIKDMIQIWLENNVKLQLFLDKTKITEFYKDHEHPLRGKNQKITTTRTTLIPTSIELMKQITERKKVRKNINEIQIF